MKSHSERERHFCGGIHTSAPLIYLLVCETQFRGNRERAVPISNGCTSIPLVYDCIYAVYGGGSRSFSDIGVYSPAKEVRTEHPDTSVSDAGAYIRNILGSVLGCLLFFDF